VREHTTCVYLECPKETLLRRLVKNNSRRPLLAGKSEEEISASIDSLMQRREEIYRTTAHHIYHTAGKRMMEVIGDFRERFGV
jgi:shikimate kinase